MRFPSWELWLLILLTVTVFGLALRGPSNSFRQSHARLESIDPYDIRPDRLQSEQAHLETGL